MIFNNSNHEMKYDPKDDGVTHINIYSKGHTELGRMLSHFYNADINHPEFGYFLNMECFWHYLSTGCQHEGYRKLNPLKVKLLARGIEKVPRDDFMKQIEIANKLKIVQHPNILHLLCESTLPFEHYYTYGESPTVIHRPNGSQELIDLFDRVRTEFKENKSCQIHSPRQYSEQVQQTS